MSTAPKILVADDSLTIRKLVEAVLCQEGYEVITADTGADCLAKATAEKPRLILLDYILPDMQGTEVCRNLINAPDTWEIPVLMMSSNGNAIRQLYQDLNNVVDYLTKPFAPNILKAVVGHLLRDSRNAEAPPADTQSAPAAEAMPKDFMDKVSRLLNLMESSPAPSVQEGAPADQIPTSETPEKPATKPKAKSRRSRKVTANTGASDAMARKFRLAIQKHLRGRMNLIPDWEMTRGTEDPEDFFLERLLSKDVLSDLSSTLMKTAGMPAGGAGALRCPSALVPLDTMLRHLQTTTATGELRIETADEIVLVCVDQGQVVLLSSNHPRNYCAGALCDFGAVPHTAIADAVRAQEEQSLPFFVSLHEQGLLPEGTSLEELLRAQGEKCLSRAFSAPEAVVSFHPLTRLSAMVRAHRCEMALDQLLLSCYRTVDDWFTLEKQFPDMEATLGPTPELETQFTSLQLERDEDEVLQAVRLVCTVAELVDLTGLKQFEVCRVLYRFLKLGMVRHGARRSNDDRVDEDLTASAAQPAPAPVLESTFDPAPEPIVDASVEPAPEPMPTAIPDAAPAVVPAQTAPEPIMNRESEPVDAMMSGTYGLVWPTETSPGSAAVPAVEPAEAVRPPMMASAE